MSRPLVRESEYVPHGTPPCICGPAGEQPECVVHGYESVIRRLSAERDRYGEALEQIRDMDWPISADRPKQHYQAMLYHRMRDLARHTLASEGK